MEWSVFLPRTETFVCFHYFSHFAFQSVFPTLEPNPYADPDYLYFIRPHNPLEFGEYIDSQRDFATLPSDLNEKTVAPHFLGEDSATTEEWTPILDD